MDLTSVETRPQEPEKEKQAAWVGMTTGAVVGALIGAVVFLTPSLFTQFPYQRMLVVVGAFFGALQGAYLGPLVGLRLSQWFGRSRGGKPARRKPAYGAR